MPFNAYQHTQQNPVATNWPQPVDQPGLWAESLTDAASISEELEKTIAVGKQAAMMHPGNYMLGSLLHCIFCLSR
jgi:hypothetical protein